MTEIAAYGCSLLRKAGYQSGVYANKNWLTNRLDADALRADGAEIWMAAWPFTDRPADPDDYDKSDQCTTWQYSDHGTVSGINALVDLDVRYELFTDAQQLGDVNNDKSLDMRDVVTMRRALTGGWNVTVDEKIADVNHDNSFDMRDVVTLRRYLSGGWGIVLN